MEENKTKAKIIAVAGKGGVGKTSLCSAIVRELVEAFPGKRILAIDADPAVGLSTCYCSVNSYLKEVISMLANDFDYVVIDGEAGIEQISRRVMEQVSHLVLVTDQSAKGVNVCREIKEAADDLITYERIGMIVNRVVDPSMNDLVKLDGVDVLAYIPTDPIHAANDIHGKSVFELPEDSNIMVGVHQALHNLGIF